MKKLLSLVLLVAPITLQAEDVFTQIQRANRKTDAKVMRVTTAGNQATHVLKPQPNNGDEALYADKRASYGKALRQLDSGLVDPVAFDALVKATQSQTQADFNAIPMGTSNPVQRKLVSPQAGISFNLDGGDSAIFHMPPAPELTSAQRAGEMVELYWMALMRDVNFTDFTTNGTAQLAIADLNNLSDFKGPKNAMGQVDADTLFRENLPGVLDGPYVSQFFYQNVPFSDTEFVPMYTVPNPTAPPGVINDFMTTFDTWFAVQKGEEKAGIDLNGQRFITTIRDIANFVHGDPPQFPYICTYLIINSLPEDLNGRSPLDPSIPYNGNPTQEAFADFGPPQFIEMISEALNLAIRAAWYQKWFVHRTLRPEVCAFLVNQQINNQLNSNLHPDVINSAVLDPDKPDPNNRVNIPTRNNALNNTVGQNVYFLPQAYPEGSPTHPSYPAGHAVVAGCCTTILKAIANEDYVFRQAKVPNADGSMLDDIPDQLTLGDELNKFGANIAVARNMAGVHYRSDGTEGMLLGEKVALAFLQDWAYSNHIPFNGFSLTKFDGTKVTVGATRRSPQIVE